MAAGAGPPAAAVAGGEADGYPRTLSTAAYMLGFAGLLPQAMAVLAIAIASPVASAAARFFAGAYALSILSFLGGIWWGFAVRRGAGQGALAAIAVVPSLAGVGIVLADFAGLPDRWALVAFGCAILLTVPIDRRLARSGDARSTGCDCACRCRSVSAR